MAAIEPGMKFSAVTGLEVSQVPDGATVYQADRERVHFLNPTALIVFELCGMGKSAGEIEDFVTDAFGLATAPTEEIHRCLQSLVDEGLVVCEPSSAAP